MPILEATPKQTYAFRAVLEDSIDHNFKTARGAVRYLPPDTRAKKHDAHRVMVRFQGIESTWWVEKSGAPLLINMPKQATIVRQVDEKTAKNFLDN